MFIRFPEARFAKDVLYDSLIMVDILILRDWTLLLLKRCRGLNG